MTSSGVTEIQPPRFRTRFAGEPCPFSRSANELLGAPLQPELFPKHRYPFFICLGCGKTLGRCFLATDAIDIVLALPYQASLSLSHCDS